MTARRTGSRKARAVVAVAYPPGFFTEPVRAWRQMRFDAQEVDAAVRQYVRQYVRNQRNASLSRELALATGAGWGNGTIDLPKTPKTGAPGWLR